MDSSLNLINQSYDGYEIVQNDKPTKGKTFFYMFLMTLLQFSIELSFNISNDIIK